MGSLTIERTQTMMRARVARLIAAVAVLLAATVSSAAAETLMMPKRDARMGVPVVVWGVTTQSPVASCTLDYGDSSPVTTCNGADRSYIAFQHTYTTSGLKTATLTVGSEVATVVIQVFDVALLPGGGAGDANRGLGINMAIQDGLRNLWVTQASRAANFPASVTTNWGNGFPYAEASLIVLAFENHGYGLANDGSAPTGLYEKYIVRRGLNYVISNLSAVTLGVTPQGHSACVGGLGVVAGDCLGLRTPADPGYSVALAMLPFAASGALARVNTEVPGVTAGMTFGQILQRLSNTEAWGMTDGVGNVNRGGVGYQLNGGQFDGSTAGWAILGFLDAAAAGATVPAWVSTEFKFGFDNTLNADGSFGYFAGGAWPGPAKVGIGLQGLYFTGELSGARVNAVKANINSWWPGASPFGIGGNAWGGHTNHGGAYAMFNNFKGLKLQGITTLPDVNRSTRPWAFIGSGADDDWHADYQDWLIANQNAPNATSGGSFGPAMSFSCCYSGDNIESAIAELILSPVALVLPDADKFGAFGLSPATDTDVEGNSHTVTAKAESTGGTPVPGATVNFLILTGPNAGLTGTDTTDSNGEATFTYTDAGPDGTTGTDTIQASIGTLKSNIVEMIWTPKNAPPVANDDAYGTNEDTPVGGNVLTNDTDADSDPLTATLVTGPTNGSLVFNADGSFTYSPALNFCGSDTFTYTANDGLVDSNVATASITIACVNDPPVANPDAKVTPEDTPVSGLLTSSDVDGGAPTYALATGPTNGSVVVLPGGGYTYTPNLNYNGPDSFTFTVSDGNGGTDTETVTILVTPVNDGPLCTGSPTMSMLWPPNHKLVSIGVLGLTDVDGDTVTVTITSISQDESTNTVGDGNTPSDGAGIGTSTAQVRAERSGNPKVPGNGRVYYIDFSGSDGNGGSCTGTVNVGVPHDQGQRKIPVPDGRLFNSVTGAPL